MSPLLNRRSLLAGLPAALLVTRVPAVAQVPSVALVPSVVLGQDNAGNEKEATVSGVSHSYPSQEQSVVKEVVGASHGNFDRVKELVSLRPELANATYDWGFGDWETALGAASHTGRKQIARFLIENGARPDIFTAAMLGNLAAVKAFVAASPGIQSHPGPHGITLLSHARAGGEEAAGVVKYLEALGGADPRYTNLPLQEEQQAALLGKYSFGSGSDDTFKVFLDRRGNLALERAGGVQRVLFHQGDLEFHPSGAPSARIRFTEVGEGKMSLSIFNPQVVATAKKL